jgi:chromosome segregation protein
MQQALADQRAAEAAIETQRAYQHVQSERVSAVQARYYEVGAEISRTESSIAHTREMREQQRNELTQARATLAELESHISRDEREIASLRTEIERLSPELAQAQAAESALNEELAAAEQQQADWQQRWEGFNREQGAAHQTTQVERARIEQLENQLRRLSAQADRLAIEREALMAQESSALLAELTEKESVARGTADELSRVLNAALDRSQKLRAAQFEAETRLEQARAERDKRRAEVVSLEALQKAALQRGDSRTAEWLASSGLAKQPRLAAQLGVRDGWERAVETALGDYLEALCVEELEQVADVLPTLPVGRVSLLQSGGNVEADGNGRTLSGVVSGPGAIVRLLSRVRLAETLAEALVIRRELGHDESVITRTGEWLGRDWLRVNRGGDPHSGVLEREQRVKQLRIELAASEDGVREREARLAACREELATAERDRDQAQSTIQGAHRFHADLLGQLEGERARSQESTVRRERLEEEAAEVTREVGIGQDALARARAELDRGLLALDALDSRRADLEGEREGRREAVQTARERSQAAQLTSRDLLVRIESRRSSESSMSVGLKRMSDQRAQTQARSRELEAALADGDLPVVELEDKLKGFLTRRLEIESDLGTERRALEEADGALRALDEKRLDAEARVNAAREAMEQARLVAQESRVRREGLVEQFAATRFDLAEILAGLAPDAAVPAWEESLGATRADLEKLGQVNLAAIDELKECSERKEYLDRQFADVTAALNTLEEAMRKIDKETRTRFEDTFNRINNGLKEKFPRLFGGGHAYLELVGEDVLSAGVAVMARPPGKRNSSIHQLSGGEKALTAVALVFSIFDLNPAPFCLLDEVDAPLDEHNVGRFCDIVKSMSERVQFIFITHNKATMELASQLLGVTMHEPGCSRLVAVDVDEAVRMASA